jgi:DNA-binding response OmpR family regulator
VQEVDITTGEFDLLTAFVNNPNQVLSRDHLLDLTRIAGPGRKTGRSTFRSGGFGAS